MNKIYDTFTYLCPSDTPFMKYQYDYAARFMDPSMIRFTTVDPHAEKYFSWSPYVYVGNNPMKLVDPDGKDWFVNNENGNVIFVKGVNKLNDDLRAQYNLGKTNYENLGADNMFGDIVQWGMYEGNLYNVLDNDFHSFGDLSQNFMKLQGYQGVENLQIEKKETREFSMDRSTDLRESYEIVDISKTYVKKETNINRN